MNIVKSTTNITEKKVYHLFEHTIFENKITHEKKIKKTTDDTRIINFSGDPPQNNPIN